MKDKNELISVYTGSEVSVMLLKEYLAEVGVYSIIQDEFNSGAAAGFPVGSPAAIDLFIQQSDRTKAEPIVRDFIQSEKKKDKERKKE
jgi:hypothetical protein